MSLRADLLEYADVLEFAGQVLGPCELEQDYSWAHGLSAVLRLRDARGVTWFAKRHRERDRHEAEVTAYRQWVPALSGHAPRLHAADDSRSAIIVSAIPGEPVPWPAADLCALPDNDRLAEQAHQREAGVLLRRFHDAQQPLPCVDFGAAKIAEFDGLMPMASQLLGKRDLALARAQVETLSGLPCPGQVPCHRDYTPRNWLVNDGVQYVIDFEHACLDVWLADLARLHLGIWPDRPDLKEAFLAGYGRRLSDTDHAILQGVAALTATWLVVKAREIRQPALEDAFRTALQRLLPTGGPGTADNRRSLGSAGTASASASAGAHDPSAEQVGSRTSRSRKTCRLPIVSTSPPFGAAGRSVIRPVMPVQIWSFCSTVSGAQTLSGDTGPAGSCRSSP